MYMYQLYKFCKSTIPVNVTKAYNRQLQNVICNFQTIYTTTIKGNSLNV